MSKQVKSFSKGEKNTENNNKRRAKTHDKTTKEIVKRHLSNKNDKITNKDLENLKIDLSVPKDKAHAPLPIKNDKGRPKDTDKDHAITTPWDVISE